MEAYLLRYHPKPQRMPIYLDGKLLHSFRKGKLTKDKESLVFTQLVIPINEVMTQVELLCRPETSLRSFVRLPYLHISPCQGLRQHDLPLDT
jgi:hypothetical protein